MDPQFDNEESPNSPLLLLAPEQEEISSQQREKSVSLLNKHQVKNSTKVAEKGVELSEHLCLQVEVEVDQVEESIEEVKESVEEVEEQA